MKSDRSIAPELPQKVEQLHFVQLTAEQRRIYAKLSNLGLRKIGPSPKETATSESGADVQEWSDPMEADDSAILVDEGGEPSHAKNQNGRGSTEQLKRTNQVLGLLHQLQQLCNHPAALPANKWPEGEALQVDTSAEHSGKTHRLVELLAEIFDGQSREKVLIFTQYRRSLDFLAELVEKTFPGNKAVRFHGGLSAKERDAAVSSFTTEPSCSAMVLTLQSGGVGLTLTAATHVIHFDRCWNPAKEAQATDRAHRIGQRSTVVVHRLTTVGTLEERLAYVLEAKKDLAGAILSEATEKVDEKKASLIAKGTTQINDIRAIGQFSAQQLQQLFKLSAQVS
eukprot:TRINITY_DN31634_c0_g1_i1.p1 TRINITY_DN31634_c0_g1~~TRINITY_DN31634_c0_g1_i1.p1  ORF type:complete len:339 (-),score=64.24 TRINITY_DN31634_c0_g1_i1:93-1109(-)